MARRRKKNITIQEELLELEQQLTETEEAIKELTSKKKELEASIEMKQMEALHQAVLQSGKSLDEVIAMLNSEDVDGQGEEQQGEM